MNKKVRIISSSPRRGGNSETLAAAFAEGAQAAGHQVETVYLREKQIGYCKGCFACHELGHCVLRDDAAAIIAKMHDADVLVFATPVYYYCVSGQLKTLWIAPTRCTTATMPLRKPICWRRRRRTRRRPSMARRRPCRAGWTASPAAHWQARCSQAA